MQPYVIAFDRLLFGRESFIRKHWFEKDDLHLDISQVGVMAGKGADIVQVDCSEAVLVFRGVSAWQRKYRMDKDPKVDKGLSQLHGTLPEIAAMPPQGYVVTGTRTGWNIVARIFECYLHEEDVAKVEAASGKESRQAPPA